ncbi:hypothetical protein [Kribbella lupini]|uniref:hypothetical protein n=1 Tax=Kribbella lupini TaxID=291602 RepID=UPI0031E33890
MLYLVLSLYYEKYYSRLGIEPSDVGLDRTAIVSRAVAGVVILLGLIVVVSLAIVFLSLIGLFVAWVIVWLYRSWLPQHQRVQLGKLWEDEWSQVRGREWIERFDRSISVFPLTLLIPAVLGLSRYPWPSRLDFALRWAMVGGIGLTIALTAGWARVERAADAAEEGRSVTPLTFVGIRVLDIKSEPCAVEWLGSPNTRPAGLRSPQLRCLGTANGAAVFRDGRSTVIVPASQVAITLK